MKRIATLFLFMLAGTSFLAAQTQPAAQQPVTKMYAWSETTHDFGKIEQSTPAPVTFTVTNNGTNPLIIIGASSSCGCTVADYTKEPILPGKTGTVKATFNAAKPGLFTKTVTVTFEGILTTDVLTIKGEVIAKPIVPDPEPK
jgi:hypothetical protein